MRVGEADRAGLTELQLLAEDPGEKAVALADLLDVEREGSEVWVGDTLVRFLSDGAQGRPQLHGELFT